ncbi:MAG: DPP IV N-terminal domain-containing protein [Candidatus Omnitrophica bacterium]|nr:DPP IV N-terminal domain-containing protein [Candidatus Omnitrophota bacterium]
MKTRIVLAILLGWVFLPKSVLTAYQTDYLLYVFSPLGVSNLYLFDLTTSESRQLTYFSDTGSITSVSAPQGGWPVYFTRPSPDNGRNNSTIWSVNLDGSGLTELTSVATNPALDYSGVAVSPNGQTIAYVANSLAAPSEYHLYVCSLTGTNRKQLTVFPGEVCSYPLFLDNEIVVFRQKTGYLENYYLMNIDGSGLTNLTNNESGSPYFPRLGRPMTDSGRSRLIFSQQIQEIWGYRKWSIYSLNLTTGSLQELTPDVAPWWGLYYDFEPNPLFQPEPYPCFVADSQVALVGTQDSNASPEDLNLYITSLPIGNPYQWQITTAGGISLPFYLKPSSPNTQIVYLSSGKIFRADQNNEITQLTWAGTATDPVVDSRGVRLAYSDNGLWLMNVNGSNLVCLESDPTARYPAFSPDSFWVAYVKKNDLYARRTDMTTSPVRLTVSPDMPKADVSFSPDGRRILFTGTTNGKRQIYSLPVSITENPSLFLPVGNPANLTPLTTENYQAKYSPDGKSIVFISTRAQLPEIWLMDPTGQRQRKISFSTNPPVNPAWPHFSPADPEILSYLSGSPQKIWTTDLSALSAEGSLRQPEIVATQFSWQAAPAGTVWAYRFLTFDRIDPRRQLTYQIKLLVDALPAPTSVTLTEVLPAGWQLLNVKINGVSPWPLTSNQQTQGSLKWNFGLAGIAPLKDTVLELTVDLSSEIGVNAWRYLQGWVETTKGRVMTSGDAAMYLDNPYLPIDTDRDWCISNEELLRTIDLWATSSQKHGWPDVRDWDYWLLLIINFWINEAAGYQYLIPTDPYPVAEPPQWGLK